MNALSEIAETIARETAENFNPDDYPGNGEPDQAEVWSPSAEQIAEHIQGQGWPTFEDFTFDHLDTAEERDRLQTAIDAAKRYVKTIRKQKGVALILVAGAIDGDMARTGYGCGKTMLAQVIHYANADVRWTPTGDYMAVMQRGRLYEARALMSLFDQNQDDGFDPRLLFKFGNCVIIDDVGREGTLRYEKRDPDIQLAEKQDRYYSIIDHCYKRGVNIVITSNMSAKELAGFLGGAAWSRLLQMCPPEFRVNMTGLPDYRPILGERQADNWEF